MEETLYDVVTAAVADLSEHGFDSTERVAAWERRIKAAAERTLAPAGLMEQMLREAMVASYRRLVDRGDVLKMHPGVAVYTLNRVRHSLRAELDRRILASANLIKLNREEAIQKTLRRFSGWSTSIPKGGSDAVNRRATNKEIRKALTGLPFVERRVLIDQGHKLTASINEIIAKDGQALAGRWRSNWRQPGYDYREDHKERDDQVYAVRGSWALDKGLIKPGPAGYYDEVTAVAEEPFCRCYVVWLYNLRDLPKEMLTRKGADELEKARAAA